jgi:hypothetical protein
MRGLRGSNASAVIAVLSPVIRGWAAYYRGVVSSRVFHSLDAHVWRLTFKWARWQHRNKPRSWIVARYFGAFNRFRNDRGVFGDRDSGIYLVKFSWTAITRHVMVSGSASPDDPALASYWVERRKNVKPPLDGYTLRLLTRQDARCPLCGEHLLTADQPPQSPERWELWWLHVTRKAIAASYLVHHGKRGTGGGDPTRLVHASCYRGRRTSKITITAADTTGATGAVSFDLVAVPDLRSAYHKVTGPATVLSGVGGQCLDDPHNSRHSRTGLAPTTTACARAQPETPSSSQASRTARRCC